jgi:hypothetical protein
MRNHADVNAGTKVLFPKEFSPSTKATDPRVIKRPAAGCWRCWAFGVEAAFNTAPFEARRILSAGGRAFERDSYGFSPAKSDRMIRLILRRRRSRRLKGWAATMRPHGSRRIAAKHAQAA